MFLQWDDQKFATGFAEVDEQHKAIFKAVNSLTEAMQQGKGKDHVAKMLAFLEQYAVKHFRCEEGYMERHNCSACAENKAAHQKFVQDFMAVKQQFQKEGVTPALIIQIQQKLCMWLVNHIGRCDVRLREVAKVSA